ncbi:MAG: hypothetical protein AAFQ66_10840 [Pseudomonadota bacterium]
MKPRSSADIWLALFFLAFALLLVLVWVPWDTGTGLVEKVRRKLEIGDALGPSVAGTVIAIGALLVLLRPAQANGLIRPNLVWMISLLGLFAVSMILMRYAGPAALTGVEGGYRPLRATAPWSYIGFLLGGTAMIGGLTGLANRRFAPLDFAIGFAAALGIALLYDLPFDDLLLPPNGDV